VFITGGFLTPDIEGFMNSTGVPYALKPFRKEDLLRAIENASKNRDTEFRQAPTLSESSAVLAELSRAASGD
jgi:FixJ family two-component response regulator